MTVPKAIGIEIATSAVLAGSGTGDGTGTKMRRRVTRLGALIFIAALLVSACGSTGGAKSPEPSVVGLSVTSGTYTTTVRRNAVTDVPFSETLIVEAQYERPIYGAAGQTTVFAQASPVSYRVGPYSHRNDQTFTFTLTNRSPGTVEVSIYENRDASPVTFTLRVGEG